MALDLNIIVGICKFHKKREPTVKCELNMRERKKCYLLCYAFQIMLISVNNGIGFWVGGRN